MRVAILGLGYVGRTYAVGFATTGHRVLGIDPDENARQRMLEAEAEADLNATDLARYYSRTRVMKIDSDPRGLDAVDAIVVCVGTPTHPDGLMDLEPLKAAFRDITSNVDPTVKRRLAIIVTSTALPGSLIQLYEQFIGPWADGMPLQLSMAYIPEFLREGTALSDFLNPSLSVIGNLIGDARYAVDALFPAAEAGRFSMTCTEAHLLKYASNTWHALKVAFANEIARLASEEGASGRTIMEALTSDARLNTSAAYLRPGSPFGGSCLPKDLRALRSFVEACGVSSPVIEAIGQSNEMHYEYIVDAIREHSVQRVLILGATFKPGTGDLRESHAIRLATMLIYAGKDVDIFDYDVRGGQSARPASDGAASANLLERLEADQLSEYDCIVFAHGHSAYKKYVHGVANNALIIDLTGVAAETQHAGPYWAVAWARGDSVEAL